MSETPPAARRCAEEVIAALLKACDEHGPIAPNYADTIVAPIIDAALRARVSALERERDELLNRPGQDAYNKRIRTLERDGERLRAALAEIIDAHDDWTTACQHDDGACPVHEIAWKCGDALTATVDHHRATLAPEAP